LHRERQTHQLRLLRVQAGGFGVKGNQLGVIELLQPYVKPRLIEDGFVLLLRPRPQAPRAATAT
jgi:hypothetical protein